MKIYISEKTIEKLNNMLANMKGDAINVRKYKKGVDKESNVFKGIKLSEKQRQLHKKGASYAVYISKEELLQAKQQLAEQQQLANQQQAGTVGSVAATGGVLPLIPLILGGLSAVGALAGGASAIAKTAIDKQANDARLREDRRHNEELEAVARGAGASVAGGFYLNPYKGAAVESAKAVCNKKIIRLQ